MRESITIEVRGAKLQFMPRVYSTYSGWKAYSQSPRMYVSVSDETVLDNLVNRKRRPYNVYKTLIHSSGISEVLNLSELRWSQRAGCTCPCSPGFVLGRQSMQIGEKSFHHFDACVTLESAPSVDERKAPRVLAGV